MENAKQEKKVGVGEVVLNSLADHMKNNSKCLKKKFSSLTGDHLYKATLAVTLLCFKMQELQVSTSFP